MTRSQRRIDDYVGERNLKVIVKVLDEASAAGVAYLTLTERIISLGGLCVAIATDVAATTRIARAPKRRGATPDQIRRLLLGRQIVLLHAYSAAREANRGGDDGTNDVIVSELIRLSEKQVWVLAELIEAFA